MEFKHKTIKVAPGKVASVNEVTEILVGHSVINEGGEVVIVMHVLERMVPKINIDTWNAGERAA